MCSLLRFYGDALITPAISVLSAVEGLGVATPHFEKFVVPITIGVLIALFSIQRFGTGRVGALFGPITCLWFCHRRAGFAEHHRNTCGVASAEPAVCN